MIIRRPMAMLSIIFMLIIYITIELSGGIDEKKYQEDGTTVTLTGVITDKVYKNNKYSIHIKNVKMIKAESETEFESETNENSIETNSTETNKKKDGINNNNCVIAYLNDDFSSLYIGQSVKIKGEYSNFSLAENEGQFDAMKYYRMRGYECSIKKAEILAVSKNYDHIKNFLYERKESTKSIFYSNLSEEKAGTLCAMVLGDKSGLDREVRDLYQSAGISHILSLSGLHIATTGLFLFSMLFKLFKKNGLAAAVSSVIMISYGVMTGMSTSTKRALIMFLLGLLANFICRTYDLLSATYLSSILILFETPYYIYDSGFLLSFSAVFGIGIIYPMFNELFNFRKEVNERVERIRQGINISISTTLATLPVVMNSFYKMARFSVIINLIVVPLMSVILFIGILAGFLGNILMGTVSIFGKIITKGLLFIAEKILDFYNMISRAISDSKVNTWVIGKGKIWQYLVYITMILLTCYFYSWVLKDKRRGLKELSHKKVMKLRGIVILLLSVALLLVSYKSKPDLRINVLSVGQGACNIIYGNDMPVILIDGGSTDVKEVYRYRIEPFLLSKGINHIDYVFITHPDTDHISGIKEMYENESTPISVGKIFMSVEDSELCKLITGGVYGDDRENYDDYVKNNQYENNIVFLKKGDKIRNGDILIECISPEMTIESGEVDMKAESINDMSLVLKMTHTKSGYTALFTGDISSEVEAQILENIKNLDFMTLAHHGSKYSNSAEFIKTVNPKIATISSGKGNSYGHPHKETLERLDEYAKKALVFRTDTYGQISLEVDNGRLKMLYYLTPCE